MDNKAFIVLYLLGILQNEFIAPSSWCVCQFRHFRKEGRLGQPLSINQKAEAEQTASAAGSESV